ncbi:MAG: PPE domain-containing protein [Pseudonocardiales bacterium]
MTTCENFGTYSHEQIRHEMYDGMGPNSQGDAMAGWHELAGRLTAVREYVDLAISGVQASQQGAAADAAVGAMVPVGSWVDEAQRLANETRNRIDNQISEFTTARNNVPEVPPEPSGWGWKDIPVIDSFTTSDQEADEAFNAEQERQARAAMISYQNGTNDQVMSVPQFAPPPAGEPDITIPTGNRSTIGGFPGGAGGGGAAPGASTPSAGVGGGAATELTAAPASTWSPGGGGPVVPPGGSGPGGPDGGRPAPVVVPAPVAGGPGGVAPRTPAAGGSRGPGAGRAGPGGGTGMRGGPGAGGFRPAGGGPGVGGFGPDRGGFGPTGSPESAAARAAGAGAAGPAGAVAGAGRGAVNAGGVPFGGIGGGRGGEDNERRRPTYLIEPDSNRLIGELPWTAPAVIGEDLPDDDEPARR